MRCLVLAMAILTIFVNTFALCDESSEGWREEFARICARSAEPEALDEAELTRLIDESEHLREKIANSTEPDSRVYLFRLNKCRAFFVFMKEVKKKN